MSNWMIREDQLDPDQRDFINIESRKKGNIWIQGFAGSGKSVLLLHKLREVLQNEPNANICIIVFTHSLIAMFRAGMKELNIKQNIPVMTYFQFNKSFNNKTYKDQFDYIFCDEVQDLPGEILSLMKEWGKTVIVAGDVNQSIYDEAPGLKYPVVELNEIEPLLSARPFTLNIIHRLTKSIIGLVEKLLPEMSIWRAKRDLTKQDVNVRLAKADNLKQEIKYIYQEALKAVNVGDSSVILLPHQKLIVQFANEVLNQNNIEIWQESKNQYGRVDYNQMNKYLDSNNIRINYIGNGIGSLIDCSENHKIILMTYHSSKGLDFDNVFLPMLDEGNMWFPPDKYSNDKLKKLFMVAMTRSKKNLYLSYIYKLNSLLIDLPEICSKIDIDEVLNPKSTSLNSTFDFDF
ncbi:3'-5' exonuclease [Haemophilus paraphrohaemolyticus]|jgi:hypothetical protein|uniref:3'-5' exonuclease n=1 Tax=Haemophilus paraphrohaemolyticus TaxID=736 RepID=UPI0028E4658A|nr:3'-5' exonuclease [Haemophilus paraphrohaemolyticus]